MGPILGNAGERRENTVTPERKSPGSPPREVCPICLGELVTIKCKILCGTCGVLVENCCGD